MGFVGEQQYDEVIEHKTMKLNGQVGYKRYGKGKFLGKGGFAKCYQGINLQTKKLVAIKVVEKCTLTKQRAKQKLLSEIKIHKTLHHKHIVEFDSVFEDSSCVYMILQLCPNKTLSEMVRKRKKLTIPETKYFISQLLSAIEYMHSNKVIHRDLKMGNIFLNESMEIKVGDFGLAAKLQYLEEKKRTMCGTPNYIAPQIVEGLAGHSYEVDIWSTGVICFALIFGRPPFETSQVKATYKKIKSCQYHFPNQEIPNQAKHFIKSILILDPKKRLTIQQMLEHPFLNAQQIPKELTIDALVSVPNFDKLTSSAQTGSASKNLLLSTKDLSSTERGVKSLSATTKGTLQLKYIKTDTFPKPTSDYIQQNNPALVMGQELRGSSYKSPRSSSMKQSLSQKQLFTNTHTKELTGTYSNQHKINIIAFVDYSTKYGLGYLINNKTYGVYFNDSSLMSIDGDKRTIAYIQNPSNKQENIQIYPYSWKMNNTLPNDKNFQKKFMLLEKFIVYLNDQAAKSEFNQSNYQKYDDFIYVKQWLKTKHAIMFRLSNKLFQVNFFDNSQILLNTQQKTVLFTSKKGEKTYQSLSKALQAKDSQMARRIKYTKEILNSIKKGRDDIGDK